MERPNLSFGFPPLTRGAKWLIGLTAVLSVVVGAISSWFSPETGRLLYENLAFRGGDVLRGRVWQLFTFTFLNINPISLLLAVLMLWMFASPLERRWKTQRFLIFYFTTTALAAAATTLVGLVAPGVRAETVAGIWTGVEALSAAFAMSFPDARINMFFVLPLQARYLIHLSLGITLLFIIMTGSVLPFVTPTLGLVAGILFAKGALAGPRHLLLRMRVWWIERRLAGRKLRIIEGGDNDEPRSSASKPGTRPKSGSDGYLH